MQYNNPCYAQIKWDLSNVDVEKLFAVEKLLREDLGVSFDTGAGNGFRDWFFDYSLKGPLTVHFRGMTEDVSEPETKEVIDQYVCQSIKNTTIQISCSEKGRYTLEMYKDGVLANVTYYGLNYERAKSVFTKAMQDDIRDAQSKKEDSIVDFIKSYRRIDNMYNEVELKMLCVRSSNTWRVEEFVNGRMVGVANYPDGVDHAYKHFDTRKRELERG